MADYNAAVQAEPKLAMAYYQLANMQAAGENVSGAIENYTRAIDSQPEQAMFWHNRGALFLRQQKESEALADFRKALSIQPEYGLAYYSKALALESLSRKQGGWGQDLLQETIGAYEQYLKYAGDDATRRDWVERRLKELRNS